MIKNLYTTGGSTGSEYSLADYTLKEIFQIIIESVNQLIA